SLDPTRTPSTPTLPLHDALPISPALPAPRQRPRSRSSLPLEGWLSLLEERAEALLRIGHREEAILQLAFEGEAFVHRHLESFRDRPLDETDRASGVLRIRQAFRKGHRLVPELRPREDAVEQAPLERFLRGDHAPCRHQVDPAALPDEPRQPLRTAGPAEYAQRALRPTDSPRPVRGDAKARRQADPEPAAPATPAARAAGGSRPAHR